MALLADAPNRLCIGDPPRNKRPLKFIGFSLEASKAGWHKRFQNLAIVKLAFILSGFHRPWQPARHLPPQLCLGLNTGNDAWPPKPGWSDIFEWNHRNFIEKSFRCQARCGMDFHIYHLSISTRLIVLFPLIVSSKTKSFYWLVKLRIVKLQLISKEWFQVVRFPNPRNVVTFKSVGEPDYVSGADGEQMRWMMGSPGYNLGPALPTNTTR